MKFWLYKETRNSLPNRRYYKFAYTAALRLGFIPIPNKDNCVSFEFLGSPSSTVQGHGDNQAFEGTLIIDQEQFEDIILIAKPKGDNNNFLFTTFWPKSQHPDAHRSYTDPLVDTAMYGNPFDIKKVADIMHPEFLKNPGVSPAALMMKIFEEMLRIAEEEREKARAAMEAAEREREKERARADEEKWKRIRAQTELGQKGIEVEVENPKDQVPTFMQPLKLESVYEGVRGKNNQRAIILRMEDGSERANNWPNNFDKRLTYAKSLEGQFITTSVWGGFDGTKWFQNIYLGSLPDNTE